MDIEDRFNIFTLCKILIIMKNGLHVLFRVVRVCHLNLLAHPTAFMCVDVSKDAMFLGSL